MQAATVSKNDLCLRVSPSSFRCANPMLTIASKLQGRLSHRMEHYATVPHSFRSPIPLKSCRSTVGQEQALLGAKANLAMLLDEKHNPAFRPKAKESWEADLVEQGFPLE
eukprot:TRINITY_DN108942_c0_g1_i1.p2 TRINITY_DN108942_c0_g1~~TRINITY_DN108942_c0_g1_i1.p2  ORF type:complete len:110 (+),score=12.00 TRINITY_DN108942_c0_g1_i1:235-564(+)